MVKESTFPKFLVADDMYINIETIKMSLETINELHNTEFFINGQEVIDRV